MSPFGNLYGVPVAVDRGLGDAKEMAFNAGSHTDTIKLRYEDFARLVKPKVGVFSKPVGGPAAGKGKKKRASKPTRRKTKAARPKSPTKRRTKKPTQAKKRR